MGNICQPSALNADEYPVPERAMRVIKENSES